MDKRISLKSTWTKRYSTVQKKFNNENHLSNYINLMESKGYKTVGIWDTK